MMIYMGEPSSPNSFYNLVASIAVEDAFENRGLYRSFALVLKDVRAR